AEAVMPKTKITGEGLQTGVRGSVLENVGTANDVLAKTPGLIKGQDGIEVIGRGAPLIYINGHKVTDAGELDRLQSNEIQSVEVITNPGAQYDATVRSVVRIKTIRRQGEGFGFNFNASDSQSLDWAEGNRPASALNVNYRTGGVDVFGGMNYNGYSTNQLSVAETASYGKDWTFVNKGSIDGDYFSQNLHGNAGVNWQMADNHYIGGKVEWGRTLKMVDSTLIVTDVFENGELVDKLSTVTIDRIGSVAPLSLGANVYYNGLIANKLNIDINLDYYGTDDSSSSLSREASAMTHDAEIHSESNNSGRMYAAKAVLSYPIWIGQLQAGTEETFSRRSDNYSIKGIDIIPASSAKVREDNYAGFASYAFYLPKVGQFSTGIRYEYVNYEYEDALNPESNLSRPYGNWFPSASYAGAFGPVQMMLSYSRKTKRPHYSQLDGAIRYNNRYIWQSGNAQLQPQISNSLSATAVWKFVTLMLEYSKTDGTIMTWSVPYNDEGIALVKPINIDTPYRNMTAFLNLTPTIGPWTMNYTVGLIPQWLTINAPDPREPSGVRATSFNGRPLCFAELFNTFTFKGGWQFELRGTVQTKGYVENAYLETYNFDLTAAIQKTLLKDGSLVLRLEGSDLTRTASNSIATDFGCQTINQANQWDTRRIKFSLRYKFNNAKSKYKGTGAGVEQKARM
ncbi:MAG: TonB-dependent receptor family protein, partial [Bacteroidales bacterium]|nr:TonB-dependent receptor family protein [Bacteroidales bacterium]